MSQVGYKFSKHYLKILRDHYSGLNLTAIKDLETFHMEQFQDSVAPLTESGRFRDSLEEKRLLIDVGFGGGFPLLPLAALYPEGVFVGFEAKAKKVEAVREIAKKMGLSNVFLHHYRIEEIEIDLPCLMTFKAVASIGSGLQWPYLARRCELYFYKGPKLREKEGEWWREKRGEEEWGLIEDISFKVGPLSRRLVGFENLNVPCGTTRKNLVKLSSLL